MSMLKWYCKVLDLEGHNDLAFREAKHKLQESFILINGRIVLIKECGSEGLIVHHIPVGETKAQSDIIKEKEIQSYEIWTPESGMYFVSDEFPEAGRPVFIAKSPIRQWHRGFNLGSYTIRSDQLPINALYPKSVLMIDPKSRASFWFKGKDLFYLEKKIGEYKEDKIVCTEPLFEQDIGDWLKSKEYHEQKQSTRTPQT
jgi:hypothetical protein